jgi:hypothetical protein
MDTHTHIPRLYQATTGTYQIYTQDIYKLDMTVHQIQVCWPVIPALRRQRQEDSEFQFQKKRERGAPVAHTRNPSYSGGRDQEDHGSKSAPDK